MTLVASIPTTATELATFLEPFWVMALAALFTSVIGLDREIRGKPAGLRTNILVGVSAAAFAYLSMTAFTNSSGTADPARLAAQVVSGAGFLGGGAVFASKDKPLGLTTAAALWGSVAVGLSVGAGQLRLAVALVLVSFIVLWPLDQWVSGLLGRAQKSRQLHLIVTSFSVLDEVRLKLLGCGLQIRDVELKPFDGQVRVFFNVHGQDGRLDQLIPSLAAHEGVVFVSAGVSDSELGGE